MYALLKIFVAGFVISLIGTLPLGTLNLSSMQISMAEGFLPAFLFAIGVLVVEMLYVRVTLSGIERLQRQKKWMKIFGWVTVLLLLLLASGSFYAAFSPHISKNVLLTSSLPRFWLGVTLSAVNPVQIPFWLGWNLVLFNKQLLRPQAGLYNSYLIGIGTGTLLGHILFIVGGRMMQNYLSHREKEIQLVIGGVFAFTAIWELVKILRGEKSKTVN